MENGQQRNEEKLNEGIQLRVLGERDFIDIIKEASSQVSSKFKKLPMSLGYITIFRYKEFYTEY